MDMSVNTNLAVADSAPVAGPIQLPRRGALYRVRHEGKTSYLFGTIHVGKQGYFPLEPEVTRALADAQTLVLELDVRANESFQLALAKYARYAPGDSIRNHLTPATLIVLAEALAKANLPMQSIEGYKPWLVANILVGMEIERHGYQRRHGVENFLLAAAVTQNKKVHELESADYQLSLFDTLDDVQQETYMREQLAELASGAALKKSAGLIDAWSVADASGIKAAWQELVTGDTVSADFMERTLLGRRNPEMASSIEQIMQTEQVAFVGVGLLHLLGDNGLPQLLRQRGYDVEKMY